MTTQFCNYTLIGEINRGGSSIIYRAQDQRGNVVALKVLAVQLRNNMAERAKFLAEPKQQPRHPNIVKILDSGECDGVPYIAMELIEGASLSDLIQHSTSGSKPITLLNIDTMLADIAKALDSTHRAGIIHRDIKPGNILIRAVDGRAFLTDFGIAQVVVAKSDNSSGTSEYMSPEQIEGKDLSPATDVYSLGVTMYQSLVGRLPFVADDALVLAHMHINDTPRDLHTLNPHITPEVSAVVMRALQKNPAQRYASTGEFARAFHKALTQGQPSPSRLPAIAAIAGGLVLVTAVVALALSAGNPPPTSAKTPTTVAVVHNTTEAYVEPTEAQPEDTATVSTKVSSTKPAPNATTTLAPTVAATEQVTVTHTPVAQFTLQAGMLGHEPWGAPTSPDGCSDFDDKQPVNKYEVPFTINNTGKQPMSGWSVKLFDQNSSQFKKCMTMGQEGLSIAGNASYNIKVAAYSADKIITRVEVSADGATQKLCVNGSSVAPCP